MGSGSSFIVTCAWGGTGISFGTINVANDARVLISLGSLPTELSSLTFGGALTLDSGATVRISAAFHKLEVTFANEVRLRNGAQLTLEGNLMPSFTSMVQVDSYSAVVVDSNGLVSSLGANLLNAAMGPGIQGQFALRGSVALVDVRGNSLGNLAGEVHGSLQLELTAAELTYFHTSVSSGAISRAPVDGAQTSYFGWVAIWDSGTMTNHNGNTFVLFLLPAQPAGYFSYDSDSAQRYRTLCEATGVHTVGSGWDHFFADFQTSDNSMPLPGRDQMTFLQNPLYNSHCNSETGRVESGPRSGNPCISSLNWNGDGGVHRATGWINYVVRRSDYVGRAHGSRSDPTILDRPVNYPDNDDGHINTPDPTDGWDRPLHPVCAHEN